MNKQASRLLMTSLIAAVLLPLAGADPLTPHLLGEPTTLDAVQVPDVGHGHQGPLTFVPPTEGGQPVFRTADDQPQSGRFNVMWRCPELSGAEDAQAVVDGGTCPQFVIDLEDLVGNPRLSVDPINPNFQVIHELHGGRGIRAPQGVDVPTVPGQGVVGSSDEPSPRARWNSLHQPHTAYQTFNGGASWTDNRYYAHESYKAEGERERIVYGIDNAISVDARGRVVLASAYAYKNSEDGQGNWTYAVTMYKQPRALKPFVWNADLRILHREHDEQDNRHVFPKNKIENLNLVYDKKTDRMVLLWLETKMPDNNLGYPNGGPAYAPKSWVMIHIMNPNEGNNWVPIEASQYVGPCKALGQPLALHGQVFFPCNPDIGYNYPNATYGRWQIHGLDINSRTTRHVSSTPMGTNARSNIDASAILVDMADTGRTALITAEGDASGQAPPSVMISHGIYGGAWSTPKDVGTFMKLLPEDSTRKVIRARVTASTYFKETGHLYFTYQEKYVGTPDEPGQPKDPRNPQSEANKIRSLGKTIGVYNPMSEKFVGAFSTLKFGEGQLKHGADPVYQGGLCTGRDANGDDCTPGPDDSIFEDLHDDIITWDNPESEKERLFSVFGDYGVARYGEMYEIFGVPVPPLPPIAPTALPLLAPSTNAAANAAAAGVLSALMLLRLLSSKKKVYAAAPTL